jgi:hypothetical protein
VLDTDQTVEQAAKAAGADVVSFQRLVVGEGIEKVVEDYAAEVAEGDAGLRDGRITPPPPESSHRWQRNDTMDLKSGYPFWAVKNGLMHAFPPLQEDLRCDVAIIGGGWLDGGRVKADYGFDAPGAILSAKAARIDPYRMAYRLLARLQKRGGAVHDRTPIARIEVDDRGATLTSNDGATIKAKHLVMAAGYASQQFLRKKVAKNRSSYAFITDPIDAGTLGALKDTMVWESARPYLYMRTTGDGRLLVGGDDDSVDIPARRDAQVDRKARKLADKVAELFPDVPLEPAFAWAGTFAETDDGLPWIGVSPDHGRRLLFAMAYGGNGITYSMLGAGLLRALVERRKHPLQGIFGFER